MITLAIACAAAGATFAVFYMVLGLSAGWSVFGAFALFASVQLAAGVFIRKKVKEVMDEVQRIMLAGREKIEAKTRRWQFRPPGSVKEAKNEIERDQRVFTLDAIRATEKMRRWKNWMPFLERQLATAQLQLRWILKDFDKVDELMARAIMIGPDMAAMKLARMQMKGESVEAMRKVYEKSAKRAKYNGNVLADACWSWILVKRGMADEAFKALTAALRKSDDAVLKTNREHLMNNRVSHFSNSALGERWYSLMLEEPKIRMQRPRQVYR
ncbi:MAG: hypothetical protein IKD42_04115 [Kiritimatiellae bacterium]|nr:hypothetical protein [Kiritimatiellia bacterium]